MPERPLGKLDALILLLLMERPNHGYGLLGLLPGYRSSQVYHSLHKLHGLGLISRREEAPAKAPVRTMYRVHPKTKGRALAAVECFFQEIEQEKERLVGALLSLIKLRNGYLRLKP